MVYNQNEVIAMPDMLVKLYDLPDLQRCVERVGAQGVEVRRAMAPEKQTIIEWVSEHFGKHWASEVDVSFSNKPISCFLAVHGEQIVGFACYEATYRDFFGPTGVLEEYRGKGIGAALTLVCLHEMKNLGYMYAIIGGAGPVEFYRKIVGAVKIEGSEPGPYRGILS